jgi:hypothetical protein
VSPPYETLSLQRRKRRLLPFSMTTTLLGFTAVDMWTYLRKPAPDAFPWKVLHAAKMVTVVIFLLLAFQFHLMEILPWPVGSP